MDLFFNELSCKGLSADNLDSMITNYALIARNARYEGFDCIRCEKGIEGVSLIGGQTLAAYCYINRKSSAVKALFTMHRRPYIPDGDEREDIYLRADKFTIALPLREIDTYGLACAHVSGSMGIGFSTPDWTQFLYNLKIKRGELWESTKIMCLSLKDHFSDGCYEDWAQRNLPAPRLESSKLIPKEKRIKSFPEHHGKDVLQKFSSRIINCPYVEEIVNSIDRDSLDKHFISRMYENIIEIRLVKDGGYGIAVRTTAKNRRQLVAIAEILKKDYGD